MQLAGYQCSEKIGEGGMASVYRGQQLSLSRPVAIKVLHQQMQDNSQICEAFERESLIIAKLSHPHIIQVIDRGVTPSGSPYFVMEYIDGIDLRQCLQQGQLSLNSKLEMCLQIAKAVAYAHSNQVIHRDLKPNNILLDAHWHVKVLDFGIAQWTQEQGTQDQGAQNKRTQDAKTSVGEPLSKENAQLSDDVVGTAAYMAPELNQAGAIATVQSDMYSLGVMMYEVFCGVLPSAKHFRRDTEELPPLLVKLLHQCLQPQPEKRPVSMSEVVEALLSLMRGSHLSDQQISRAKKTLGKKSFTLLDVLLEDQNGAVYLFSEARSGRQVVVKKTIGSEQGLEESRLLTQKRHDHIAFVHGVSKNEHAFITVTDYVSGGVLQERLVSPYCVDRFLVVATQILSALQFAHELGVVHGNVRANKILFDRRDHVQLVDFGLYSSQVDSIQAELNTTLRHPGWFSIPDRRIDAKTDLFSAGVVFYQMLIGEMPRWNGSALQTGKAFRRLPAPLQRLLESLLQHDKSKRPDNAAAVIDRLNTISERMDTVVWSVGTSPVHRLKKRYDPQAETKRVLLFLLLILFFIVLLNAGLITWYQWDA